MKRLSLIIAIFTCSQVFSKAQTPTDFAVPRSAIQDISVSNFSGGMNIQSESLSKWLTKTGDFGKKVGLQDSSVFQLGEELGSKKQIKKSIQEEGAEASNYTIRICDIVYQLLRVEHKVSGLSYRDDHPKRDKMILLLLQKIKKSKKE